MASTCNLEKLNAYKQTFRYTLQSATWIYSLKKEECPLQEEAHT
jgi:hypothetical protein